MHESRTDEPPTPAERYYAGLVGSWRGLFHLEITDAAAMRRSSAPLLVRWGLLLVAFFPRLGLFWMETLLERDDTESGVYVHTTRVSRFGFTSYSTSERLTLAADGRSLTMVGETAAPFGRPERYDATATIADDASGATYAIPWLGEELTQRTRVVPEGLELTQETRWSRATVLLHRVGSGA